MSLSRKTPSQQEKRGDINVLLQKSELQPVLGCRRWVREGDRYSEFLACPARSPTSIPGGSAWDELPVRVAQPHQSSSGLVY
ncbi:MAG: hypothetical protein F6K36_18155 [Symploca sp. SIO3C6]|nr:hypothetical protein [Symploca sp. SIO3C6]